MKKTLKAISLAAGLTLLSAPVSSYAAVSNTTAVQYHNQWVKKGTYWTYYNANGTLQKGWLKLNNKWYFFDGNGYMKIGWLSSGGKWYYFDASGVMRTGWTKVSNKWYYFTPDGAMKTGWAYIADGEYSSYWYYFDANGAMKTGWLKSGTKWYYLSTDGNMLSDQWLTDGTKSYYLLENGEMISNQTLNGFTFDNNGVWIPSQKQLNLEAIASSYGMHVYYEDLNNNAGFGPDEVYGMGFFSNESIFGANDMGNDFYRDMAYALGAPATKDELMSLINQAVNYGEAANGKVHVSYNDYGWGTNGDFTISWGSEY